MLTAYDFPTAKAEAAVQIDIILVGDSVGTNVLGYASEKEVTLTDIAHHVGAVRRGAPETPILADLPFASYKQPAAAVANAKQLIEAGADLVKFEGPRPEIAAALKAAGICCCGHLGLEPQHHAQMRLKGRSVEEAGKLLADARALDAAGISMLVLELIPEEVAARITKAIAAPTIGIGAGRFTDGQVLVIHDMLGIGAVEFPPQPPLCRDRRVDQRGIGKLCPRRAGETLSGRGECFSYVAGGAFGLRRGEIVSALEPAGALRVICLSGEARGPDL